MLLRHSVDSAAAEGVRAAQSMKGFRSHRSTRPAYGGASGAMRVFERNDCLGTPPYKFTRSGTSIGILCLAFQCSIFGSNTRLAPDTPPYQVPVPGIRGSEVGLIRGPVRQVTGEASTTSISQIRNRVWSSFHPSPTRFEGLRNEPDPSILISFRFRGSAVSRAETDT